MGRGLRAAQWLLPLAWSSALAATYYVSLSGNDANPGTASAPWRTIQKAANTMLAGDTVQVAPGNYSEYVVTRANGSAGNPIHFRADPPNDPNRRVITKQFRVRHRFNTFEGFKLTGAQDLNMAAVRIEYSPPSADGSGTMVTNNSFHDGVYLITDDLRFSSADNGITTQKGDWLARGFEPGGYVFLGSNSKDPYANHDTAWRVRAVTSRTLYLTNNARASFVSEPAPSVWGVVYAGNDNDATPGVHVVIGSGTSAATNCTIVGNTFSNLFGCPIKLNGDNHLVEGNTITRIHGYYGIQPQGRNHVIRGNLFKDCTNFIFFTARELNEIPHPEGGNYFDYQVAFVSSFGPGSTNILFERNWVQNSHNQLGLISHASGAYGFTLRSNVFVGVQAHLSGSRSGLRIENNTFYRCAFDEGRSVVLGLGGVNGVIQRDLVVKRNAFIDCGSHASLDNEGFYGVVDSANPVLEQNFVCGPETLGFAGKRFFSEPLGINGGDPVLLNAADPLGPDQLPFTADDGLHPLPNSPLVVASIGALAPATLVSGLPTAHFQLLSPMGWFDALGTNFNPSWALRPPYVRGDVIRPYQTPEALGSAPVTARLSAASSIDGLSLPRIDNAGLVAYRWDFGDGQTTTTSQPIVDHLYRSPGVFSLTLTVSNSLGNVAQTKRAYRVLPSANGGTPPSPPTRFRFTEGP